MINAVYLDTVAQIARAAMSGTSLPSIASKLLSRLQITGIFFSGDDVVTIDTNSGKCVIKPKDAPAGAPALIDTTAELVTVGADTHYVFAWASADSVELRSYLDAQADPTQPVEMRCEIEYAISGNVGRIAFPIMMQTSYTRPEDPAPSATSDTSWAWLKLRAPAANGFSHDDPSKTLSVPGVAAQTSAAAEKTTPVEADKIPLIDSAAAGALKWVSWTRIKATLKTYFDGVYSTFSGTWADLSGKPSTFAPSGHAHPISDVTGLQTALDGKAASSHAHAIGDVTGLQTALDGKAATSHTHVIADVATLQTALNGKAPISHSHSIANVTGLQAALDGKAASTHAHAIGDVTGLQTALDGKADATHAARHKSGGVDAIKLDELAAPTDVTTLNATTSAHGLLPKLGGGTTNFLRADGSWAAPAGGGGSALVRGSGTLQGHTTAGAAAGAPAQLSFPFNGISNPHLSGYVNLVYNSNTYIIFLQDDFTAAGDAWVNTTDFSTSEELSSGLASAINTLIGTVASAVGSVCVVDNYTTGASSTLSGESTYNDIGSIGGGGSGTDAVTASGAVQEVVLIPQSGVKAVLPVKIAYRGDGALNGTSAQVCLKVGSSYYQVATLINGVSFFGDATPAAFGSEWVTPRASSSLVVRYTTTPPVGGAMTFIAIAEQN